MSGETRVEESCNRCGKEALGAIGEEALCESCIHGDSACCGRFSDDGPE